MSAFAFSDEAILFSNEYQVVEEIQKSWRANLDRFHQLLFAGIKPRLDELQQKQTAGSYRYWWLKRWERPEGTLKLWQPLHYPDLIRDHTIEFHAYFTDYKKWEIVHPVLQTEASTAVASIRGMSAVQGNVNSERPLTLRLRWENDPIEEGVQGLIVVMGALDGIVPALQLSTPKA